jgi:large subunit ribosomal protein L17
MRHRVNTRKLGRTSAHRVSMFRNMVSSLIEHEKLETTHEKARLVGRLAERMITLGKRESLAARRRALAFIRSRTVVSKLFDTLAPRFAERAGGYTRIIRLGFRDGDGARMAILELVGSEYKPAKAEEKKGKKGKKEKRAKEEGSAIEPEKKKRAAAE